MLLLWCRGCFVFSGVTWAPRKYKLVVCDVQKKIWLNFKFGFCLMVGLDLEDLFQAKSFYDKWSSNYLLTVHHNESRLSFSCDLCERSTQTRHCYRTGLIQFWNQTANQPRGKKGKGDWKLICYLIHVTKEIYCKIKTVLRLKGFVVCKSVGICLRLFLRQEWKKRGLKCKQIYWL